MQRTKIFYFYSFIFSEIALSCGVILEIKCMMWWKEKKANILWTDYFYCHSQPNCTICNSENMNVRTIENIGTKLKTMVAEFVPKHPYTIPYVY